MNIIGNSSSSFEELKGNDEIAARTSWSPLKSGGTNFRTRKLVENGQQYQLKATTGALLFGGIFLLVGIGSLLPVLALLFGNSNVGSDSPPIWFIGVFPIVFGGVGFGMLKSFSTPVVFDGRRKVFYRGKRSDGFRDEGKCKSIPFDQIHALQIISEWCRSSGENGSSYYSYELNIVLKDGERFNVMDHGNKRKLVEDAVKISHFLNVPLWGE